MDYIVLNLEGRNGCRGIAQIGAVRVDEKLNVLDTFRMSLSEGDREGFVDAAEKFRLWCGDSPLVTWGMEDMYLLTQSMEEAGIDLDWMPEVFDGQAIYQEQMGGYGRQAALNYAMAVLGMKPRRVSSALTGSMNMVRVLQNLSFTRGIESQRWGYECFADDYEMCDSEYELA